MTVVATTVKNEQIYLNNPVSMMMECESGVPADTLSVVFAVNERFDEFKFLKLYCEGKLIFNGVVDNHVFIMSEAGEYLKLSVRSMAALLLDNEAMPQTYVLPSISTIFSRHAKPYGFEGLIGESNLTAKEFTVLKGMSQWDVIQKFCTEVLGVSPVVTVDNFIDIRKSTNYTVNSLNIGNNSSSCYSYSLEEDINRYNLLSDINVRVKNDSLYSEIINDKDAIKRGIVRTRYLDLAQSNNKALSSGEAKLHKLRKKAYKIKLKIEGYVDAKIGMKVNLDDRLLGKVSDMVIDKIRYNLGLSKDSTEITLRRE